ncbi:MAG: thioredoxin family protein [Candidatus Thermoplasmatota archaeon]|nr:thioredoxin family protein [Candidatus Thermoplasmatota archaeon]
MKKIFHTGEFEKAMADCKEGRYALVVDWTAEWCYPCQMLKPLLKKLEKTYPAIVIVQVDVDDFMPLSDVHHVRSMPTLDWYSKGGERVHRSTGVLSWETVKKYARMALGGTG